MVRSVEAIVKPDLLAWARKESGLTVDAAAKKVNVKPDRLESWESGELRPTVKQLRKLANAYKRPLAVFYLPEPPDGFAPLTDYRQLPGDVPVEESPQLRYEIRRAYHRREIAIELFEAVSDSPPVLRKEVNLEDDPEGLAMQMREILGVSYDDQTTWRRQGRYKPFNEWRSALERIGVLIFQAEKVELEEMRGFSISEKPFPAIVVNIKDSPSGRVFTIMHELIHILLEDRGLCNLQGEAKLPAAARKVEVFCNRVAGAILVPRSHLLREETVREKGTRDSWSDDELKDLAYRYGVSREVILRRLLICGRTSKSFYEEKRQEVFLREKAEIPERTGESWGPLPHTSAISRAGKLFVRLVLDNYYKENITLSEVSEYLGVRLKHLRSIEAAVLS